MLDKILFILSWYEYEYESEKEFKGIEDLIEVYVSTLTLMGLGVIIGFSFKAFITAFVIMTVVPGTLLFIDMVIYIISNWKNFD